MNEEKDNSTSSDDADPPADKAQELRIPATDPVDRPVVPRAPDLEAGGGCLVVLGKAIVIFAVGIFVLGGLVFATCLLSFK